MLKIINKLFNYFLEWYMAIIIFLILIVIWQLLSNFKLIEPWLLPSPIDIIKELINSKEFMIYHTGVTAIEVISGFLLAIVLGAIFGLMMNLSKVLQKSLLPYIIASQVIPIFALAPILIVWFGAGFLSKIIVVFLISFFPIVIGVFDGLKNYDTDMENLLKTMGANKIQIYLRLRIKLALQSLFSGMKVSSVSSVIGAVVAEWIGSKAGLGWIMKVSGPLFQTDRVFASILLLSIFASILFYVVKLLENNLSKINKGV